MYSLCEVSALLQKRYDSTMQALLGLLASNNEVETQAVEAAITPQSRYLGVSEAGVIPTYSQPASCSVLRVGEPKAQTFTILGLMLMLFGSCSTVAVGASNTTPKTTPRVTEDPFTTMNGYGDRVY